MTVHSCQNFAGRLRAGARLAGTFVKTPTGHATEMLGLLGFDFVVFDMEHAAIDISARTAWCWTLAPRVFWSPMFPRPPAPGP